MVLAASADAAGVNGSVATGPLGRRGVTKRPLAVPILIFLFSSTSQIIAPVSRFDIVQAYAAPCAYRIDPLARRKPI